MSSKKSLIELTCDALRASARLRKGLQIAGPVIGTGLAGVIQACVKLYPLPEPWAGYANTLALALIMFVFAVAAVLAISDNSGPQQLLAATEAQATIDALKADATAVQQTNADAHSQAEWLATLYTTSIALRQFIEPVIMTKGADIDRVQQITYTLLDVMLGNRTTLLGIVDERWNLAVYTPTSDGEKLECFACRRRDRADEDAPHRSWPKSVGHVGRAFTNRRETIAEDVRMPQFQDMFHAPDGLHRDDDTERYRSIAAIPITCGHPEPLGVLIATSDRPGRYRPRTQGMGHDSVEPLRQLAAVLAQLFSIGTISQKVEVG